MRIPSLNNRCALPALLGALLLAPALLGGCGGGGKDDTYNPALVAPTGPPAPPAVAVSVSPPSATIVVGGTQTFTASVTNTTNTAVTWSVQGGAANGSIDAGGTYTAPGTPGTFTVVATSIADPTRSGTATVTVQAAPPTTGGLSGTIQ